MVTAWVALTPSTEESGCLSFLPGTHHSQLPHTETDDQLNILALQQEVDMGLVDKLGESAVLCPLGHGGCNTYFAVVYLVVCQHVIFHHFLIISIATGFPQCSFLGCLISLIYEGYGVL